MAWLGIENPLFSLVGLMIRGSFSTVVMHYGAYIHRVLFCSNCYVHDLHIMMMMIVLQYYCGKCGCDVMIFVVL